MPATPDTERIRFEVHNGVLASTQARAGDLLLSRTGTVGKAAVLHDKDESYNFAAHLFAVRLKNGVDADFLAAFFNSKPGRLQSERMQRGTIIQGLSIYDIPGMRVPEPPCAVQIYIGDKVRQAERLRVFATENNSKIIRGSTIPEIDEALAFKESKSNRVSCHRVNADRLDSKYYAIKQEEVLRVCSKHSDCNIADLNPAVSNGFEERGFVESGLSYITVSELATGRLDLSNCPKIDVLSVVPAKAKIDSCCVLVARSGSIGTAVKVHQRHSHAVISSHLIRLRFENEYQAIAVAAFLNSSAGNCLIWKISYGAVQSQIGQDELLSLPIPNVVLLNQQQLLECWSQRENSIEIAQSLVAAAKLLVEALIERKLTEDELIHAQTCLERGDDRADRAILSRLFERGLDATVTRPLFPDLDAYYETLRMVELEQTEVAAK